MCILGHLRRDGSTQRCCCSGRSRASTMELPLCCSSLLRPSLLLSDLGYGRDGRHQATAARRGPSSATTTTHELQARHAFKYEMRTHMAQMFLTTKAMVEKRLEAKDQKI